MWYIIRQIFLKGGTIKDAIHHIFKATGKMPTKSEGMKIINVYQDVQKHSGKVIQFPKDKITNPFIPRLGAKTEEHIKYIKSLDPVDSMKEANKVIGRKGQYKKLTPEESQKILKDTDDHIFQRDIKYDEFGDPIKPDPEDLASGGIAGQLHLNRPGYFFGGPAKGSKALKAIMDAWRANKTWGVGGPPYKPEATSFNIKEMTKRLLGEELNLSDLREMSKSPLAPRGGKGHFEDFNRQFKNIKAQVLREKMMEQKLQAESMITASEKTMKEAIEEGGNVDMAKRITDQAKRQGLETLKEVKEGLKEIEIYMGMLQKKGRTLQAEGGLAHVLGV